MPVIRFSVQPKPQSDRLLGGINLYSYVRGNPLSKIDPIGFCGNDDDDFDADESEIINAVLSYFSSNPDVALAVILSALTDTDGLAAVDAAEDATVLFHGTDAASAADILANGVNMESAAVRGGGDAFWTTTSSSDASLFAQANPVLGSPATVSLTVPNSVLNSLSSANLLSVQGPVYLFEPGAASILNSAAIFNMVPK